MDRLLTEEEIGAIPITNLGGNIDDLNIAKAQDAKTLRAVGEWLEFAIGKDNMKRSEMHRVFISRKFIETLKQGEMPE